MDAALGIPGVTNMDAAHNQPDRDARDRNKVGVSIKIYGDDLEKLEDLARDREVVRRVPERRTFTPSRPAGLRI